MLNLNIHIGYVCKIPNKVVNQPFNGLHLSSPTILSVQKFLLYSFQRNIQHGLFECKIAISKVWLAVQVTGLLVPIFCTFKACIIQ